MTISALLKKITIGALRQRVQIERSIITDDGAGGGVRSWQPLAAVWARIEPVTMARSNADGQTAQIITHRIIMRWRNDVDAACRITLNARTFQIHAIADADERRRFLIAQVEEIRP